MTDKCTFTATTSEDGRSFTMAQGEWTHTTPITTLESWIGLYQSLHDRGMQKATRPGKRDGKGGPWAGYYQHPLATLKALQAAQGAKGLRQ